MPLLQGDATVLHDTLFAEINFHSCYDPARSPAPTRWVPHNLGPCR
jgi:hypothetical protein